MKAYRCNQFDTGSPLYFLDSNAFVELGRFYQNGRCSSREICDSLKKLIINAQCTGGRFEIDLVANELSFDYGTNKINIDVKHRAIQAVETLIEQIPKEELDTFIRPTNKQFIRERNQCCNYKSIFDCNFPQVFLNDDTMCDLFYISYLYRLKIQELYQAKHLTPMDRVKQLFYYMTDTIELFGDIEFQVGKMLFIGDKSVQFAKSLLKVDTRISVALMNNSVADIVLFRIARMMGAMFACPVYFVTSDKGLQSIFETNTDLIICNQLLPRLYEDSSDVRPSLQNDWELFYKHAIYPTMYRNFITSFLYEKDMDITMDKVKNEIKKLESAVISGQI